MQDVRQVASKQLGGGGGSQQGAWVPEGRPPKHKPTTQYWPSPVNLHRHTQAEEHQTDRSLYRVPWCLLEPVDSNHTWTCA